MSTTEQPNPNTAEIDRLSTLEALRIINAEDKKVADAVAQVLPAITKAVDGIVARLEKGISRKGAKARRELNGIVFNTRRSNQDNPICPPPFKLRAAEMIPVLQRRNRRVRWFPARLGHGL